MAIELITGGNGTLHVQSADDASIWGGVIGQNCYVTQGGDGVSCTMATANEAQIGTGVGVIYGHAWRIKTTTSVTIDSGTQAQRRHDLVCVHFTTSPSETVHGGVEAVELVVLKGTPTSEAEADDPEVPGGSLLEGATDAYMPLWRIPLDGISVGSPERMFETVEPLASCLQVLASGTIDEGRATWRLMPGNRVEVEGITEEFTLAAHNSFNTNIALPAPVAARSFSVSFSSGQGWNNTSAPEPSPRTYAPATSDADNPRFRVVVANPSGQSYGGCSVGWSLAGTVDEAGAAAFLATL